MRDLIIPRRSFLKVLTGVIAAPAVIKADQLMRVKAIVQPANWSVPLNTSWDVLDEPRVMAIERCTYGNNMDVFKRIVMEGLKDIQMDIDKRSLDIMFTPQRKGFFS